MIGVLFVGHKTQCPQICIELTWVEDNDGRKLPLKSFFGNVFYLFLINYSSKSVDNVFCVTKSTQTF